MGHGHHCRIKVTKKSDCFRWLKELKNRGFVKFQFNCLPASLKNLSMLYRAAASKLIIDVEMDNNGRKTWKLNIFEISRIENEKKMDKE